MVSNFIHYITFPCLSSSHYYTLFIFHMFDKIGCLQKSYFRGTFSGLMSPNSIRHLERHLNSVYYVTTLDAWVRVCAWVSCTNTLCHSPQDTVWECVIKQGVTAAWCCRSWGMEMSATIGYISAWCPPLCPRAQASIRGRITWNKVKLVVVGHWIIFVCIIMTCQKCSLIIGTFTFVYTMSIKENKEAKIMDHS